MRVLLLLSATLVACSPGSDKDPEPCSAGEPGIEVGDLLVDVPAFVDCDDNEVKLRDLVCGETLTLIDVGAAAFPSCVESTDLFVGDATYTRFRQEGLQVVQIFTADAAFQPAEVEFCADYSEEHAIDFPFLIDPLAYSDALGDTHPLSIVVDGEGIVIARFEGTDNSAREAFIAERLGE